MSADLIDTFAVAAMSELMAAYAPEKLSAEEGGMEVWSDFIARTSYYMALKMLEARAALHSAVAETTKEDDNA